MMVKAEFWDRYTRNPGPIYKDFGIVIQVLGPIYNGLGPLYKYLGPIYNRLGALYKTWGDASR